MGKGGPTSVADGALVIAALPPGPVEAGGEHSVFDAEIRSLEATLVAVDACVKMSWNWQEVDEADTRLT